MNDLRDRVAVITGGASGIGYAMAGRFAAEGMRVALADVDGWAAAAAADRLRAVGAGEAVGVAVDVRRPESVEALATAVYERWGAAHVLCNNAGVQMPGRAWEFTAAEWDWVLGVNLLGVVHGIRAFVPRMIAGGEPGHIVNTASVGGLVAYPGIGMYTASKFAVVGLSETLRHDLHAAGAPIGVSVLAPGPTVSGLRENSGRLRPGGDRGREVPLVTHFDRMPAERAAEMVVDAIRGDRFWVLTHPEYRELILRRARGIVETGDVVVPPDLAR
jgi:NAD(P)-dependent dehydrogenase (short-subunit alcohol dehydrogenase family)